MATDKNKKVKKKKKISVPEGRAYISAGQNNTIVTITDPNGDVLAWSTAGANGFKGTKKSTPYAAQVTAESTAEKVKAFDMKKVQVFVKGVGVGREQAIRGLVAGGLEITTISDVTPVPHNGCRKPGVRRV